MEIHIHRGGQQHGPYSFDQVKAWLASGEVSASIMCSTDGGTSWVPVHCIPEIRSDESLASVIRTATSGDVEIEARIIDETIKELEEMMSNSDPANIVNIQGRIQWKLRILYKQAYSLKAEFPESLAAQVYEAALFSCQARAKLVSVGGWRKSQIRSSNIAWGIVSDVMANKQEMKNATEALSLLDTALSIHDNVNDRLFKAYLYKEIKQSENAIKELNHIIVNFPGDPLYISVRQMKTEIEGL